MDARLLQLLTSFIDARDRHALVRLEAAMDDSAGPAPPSIGRFTEASQRALRDEWPEIEAQLERALADLKRRVGARPRPAEPDERHRRLAGSLRELDQYARAIRWVLTVTESPRYDL